MRPRSLDDIVGQPEAKRLIESFVRAGQMPNVVFWGPPGCGKTTMSRLLARLLDWHGVALNATSASVKEIRQVAADARDLWLSSERRTLVFIDEIHRLNKGQQDVLLPFLENGTFVLAGSTTENPYFSINHALRSRAQVVRLELLKPDWIKTRLLSVCEKSKLRCDEEVLKWLSLRAGGDLRMAITALESASYLVETDDGEVTLAHVQQCLQRTQVGGDRDGDSHYDLASAYQKSMRGSDANAAVYYLARFLESGEDPRFIARRLLVTASEDVGNADPQAFLIAEAAYAAVERLGLPECKIPLSQATIYVAQAPKSNQSVAAIGAASDFIGSNPLAPIPIHLRDTHYKGAAELGHGKDYVYSHKHPEKSQKFLPDEVGNQIFVASSKRSTPPLDDPLLERLRACIKESADGDKPFEIQVHEVAKALELSLDSVRQGINQLVANKTLVFHRFFSIRESEDEKG
jgi:putative ATPase